MKRLFVTLFVFLCLTLAGVKANKTDVEVKAPESVKTGTEVAITINVIHKGNSKSHHTEWVFLRINGKEVKRWSYTKDALPPDSVFTVEYKIIAGEPLMIEAEGNCNIHGSTGLKTTVIKTTN
jgi:desulfoferrodoxin (superoxide reductase-like protein)